MALIKVPARVVNSNSVNPFVNSVFDNLFNDSFVSGRPFNKTPFVNISESEGAYHIELAAPGLDKSDFKIDVDKGLLTISVDKSDDTETLSSYSKREFDYSLFKRTFSLSELVDYDHIDANYVHGVLKVVVGKKKDAIIYKKQVEVL